MTTAHQITWRERLEAYYYLCRFDKPVGTELVFWPTMWALWIAAEGIPPMGILIPMVLGTNLCVRLGVQLMILLIVKSMRM